MIKNQMNGKIEKPVAEMSDGEVLDYLPWAPHLTIAQMRDQLSWWQSPNFRRVA